VVAQKKREKRALAKQERLRGKMELAYDKINKLPKNVTY
jgi:hypothetical protein